VSICLNTGRSELRARGRRPAEDLISDGLDQLNVGLDLDDPASGAVRRLAVAAALNGLPDVQRTSIVLCDMAGLTAQEAADLLACPRGTVLARLHRGRRRLVQLLEQEGIHDGA
jgi:RNA polymerase sigma-70 factor (ECF subfamily)